jgi:hypothetical protein
MFSSYSELKLALLASILLVITACSGKSYYYYTHSEHPDVTPAAIKPWYEEQYLASDKSLDVFPIYIDGKITEIYSRDDIPTYYILPGQRRIKVALTREDGVRIVAPETLTFEAIPGRSYVSKATIEEKPMNDGKTKEVIMNFMIADEITEEIVSRTIRTTIVDKE